MEIEKHQNKENNGRLADMCYVYAKTKWMQTFKAFDLNGFFAGKLIYASMLLNDSENQEKLQRLADENRGMSLQFQLRKPSNGSIMYETRLAA